MAEVKTGADHLRSLQDGRAVYIDGERVEDVTTHPAFRNACAAKELIIARWNNAAGHHYHVPAPMAAQILGREGGGQRLGSEAAVQVGITGGTPQ